MSWVFDIQSESRAKYHVLMAARLLHYDEHDEALHTEIIEEICGAVPENYPEGFLDDAWEANPNSDKDIEGFFDKYQDYLYDSGLWEKIHEHAKDEILKKYVVEVVKRVFEAELLSDIEEDKTYIALKYDSSHPSYLEVPKVSDTKSKIDLANELLKIEETVGDRAISDAIPLKNEELLRLRYKNMVIFIIDEDYYMAYYLVPLPDKSTPWVIQLSDNDEAPMEQIVTTNFIDEYGRICL